MTATHYRQIVAARRACEVNAPAHVGKPLGIRRAKDRRWWRWGR